MSSVPAKQILQADLVEVVRAPLGAVPRVDRGGARILYVANVAWFFRSHRLPLALEAVRRGYDVHLATAFRDQQERREFEDLGITTHEVPFERSGTGPAKELATFLRLRQLYVSLRPFLTHNVSIKPIVYGGILGRLYGISRVNAVSGLGYAYIAKGVKAAIRRAALNLAYSVAVGGRHSRVIVQNKDDLGFFQRGLKVAEKNLVLIRGAGVDLTAFDPRRPPSVPPVVVLPARMLADKGVREFAAAARILKSKGVSARFALVGGLDPGNRAGLTQDELGQITADGMVEYWGYRSDMPEVLGAAQIVCLPSYREGLPKALLDACAAGRAIVTTDVPGCREVVKHGYNGLLVPPRDADALAQALEQLLNDTKRCVAMGRNGRQLAENYFSVESVVDRTLQIYEEFRHESGARRPVTEDSEVAIG